MLESQTKLSLNPTFAHVSRQHSHWPHRWQDEIHLSYYISEQTNHFVLIWTVIEFRVLGLGLKKKDSELSTASVNSG